MTPGPLIIVSGPSGSGKSTLIRRVLVDPPLPLRLAVSATTRPARKGEENGVHYHFWSPEQFQQVVEANGFLEHAIIHGKHAYGTPRSEIDGYREKGMGVILDIDVQGAAQVRPLYPDHLSIFIALSRWERYEERIRTRGSETEEGIARRLATAREELERQAEYQFLIYNDDLEQAVARFHDLTIQYLARRRDATGEGDVNAR